MSLYSVLLVDDEEEVINVIEKKMDWNAMGYSLLGKARNGLEGLEFVENNRVDVVLSDIKMPYMDGLSMAREIRKTSPNTRVIFFSGFDEFEYAKEAIEIEAESYLLKPLNFQELKEVFENLHNKLDNESSERRDIKQLKTYYEESLPLLQDNFFVSLIAGRIPEHEIQKYIDDYQINVEGSIFVVTAFHISPYLVDNGDEESMDQLMLHMSAKKFIEDKLRGKFYSKVLTYLEDVVVFSAFDKMEDITTYTDELDRICKLARAQMNIQMTAGIGYECTEAVGLPMSYEGAKSAASYRTQYGHSRAIRISEVEPVQNSDTGWTESYIQAYLKAVKFKSDEELNERVNALRDRLLMSPMNPGQFQIFLMELATELFRFYTNNDEALSSIKSDMNNLMQQVMSLDSPDSLGRFLMDQGGKMKALLNTTEADNSRSFVERARDYVKDHFAEQELSLETICGYLGVSNAHFSTQFKKETGKTFINYLTDYRMEVAERLIMEGQDKTYVVAEKVGYQDANYFSYVFKRKFGVSPSKYRDSLKEE